MNPMISNRIIFISACWITIISGLKVVLFEASQAVYWQHRTLLVVPHLIDDNRTHTEEDPKTSINIFMDTS